MYKTHSSTYCGAGILQLSVKRVLAALTVLGADLASAVRAGDEAEGLEVGALGEADAAAGEPLLVRILVSLIGGATAAGAASPRDRVA